ncbi:hypothetical protein [Actinophytocola sp. NPDC049390]|uniref:hypothetical protein n=1 Tax=Actinophytocola sp. NPDC049390 TaxID=3363894 RepID=UPI003795CB17
MPTTALPRRAAAPARVWVSATALPGAATLMLFWLTRVVETDKVQGFVFSAALTFLVITCTIGPIVCWAWRTHALEDRTEDDLADIAFRLRRLETAQGHTCQAAQPVRSVGGPNLYLVRDDAQQPEWN